MRRSSMRIENGLPRIPPPQAAVTLLKGESYVKRTLLINWLMRSDRFPESDPQRTKGTFLIVAARCPVCGEPVCLHRSTYQNNHECPLRLPTNEITRTTSPDSLVYKPNDLTGHQASIDLVLVSAPPALMATFTASSIGSLKGTSIRSRPCS